MARIRRHGPPGGFPRHMSGAVVPPAHPATAPAVPAAPSRPPVRTEISHPLLESLKHCCSLPCCMQEDQAFWRVLTLLITVNTTLCFAITKCLLQELHNFTLNTSRRWSNMERMFDEQTPGRIDLKAME